MKKFLQKNKFALIALFWVSILMISSCTPQDILPTPSSTSTHTMTLLPSSTFTQTIMSSSTSTLTQTFTITLTHTLTPSPSLTHTTTPTNTHSPTLTNTSTPTPTNTTLPTVTNTPTSPSVIITTGDVQIIRLLYNGVVSNLEPDEYVEIQNLDTNSIQLQNWTLSDLADHVYWFPSFVIAPNQICRIYTNETHEDFCSFSYRASQGIWNNSGDTAYLKDSTGNLIDEYSY